MLESDFHFRKQPLETLLTQIFFIGVILIATSSTTCGGCEVNRKGDYDDGCKRRNTMELPYCRRKHFWNSFKCKTCSDNELDDDFCERRAEDSTVLKYVERYEPDYRIDRRSIQCHENNEEGKQNGRCAVPKTLIIKADNNRFVRVNKLKCIGSYYYGSSWYYNSWHIDWDVAGPMLTVQWGGKWKNEIQVRLSIAQQSVADAGPKKVILEKFEDPRLKNVDYQPMIAACEEAIRVSKEYEWGDFFDVEGDEKEYVASLYIFF